MNITEINQWYMGEPQFEYVWFTSREMMTREDVLRERERAQREIDRAIHETKAGS